MLMTSVVTFLRVKHFPCDLASFKLATPHLVKTNISVQAIFKKNKNLSIECSFLHFFKSSSQCHICWNHLKQLRTKACAEKNDSCKLLCTFQNYVQDIFPPKWLCPFLYLTFSLSCFVFYFPICLCFPSRQQHISTADSSRKGKLSITPSTMAS